MKFPGNAKRTQLFLGGLIALSALTLGCYEADSSGSVQLIPPENSEPRRSRQASLNQPVAQEELLLPLLAERETFKRVEPDESDLYLLALADDSVLLPIWTPADRANSVAAPVVVHELSSRMGQLSGSAQKAAFVTRHSEKTQVDRFRRSLNARLQSFGSAYRAALQGLFSRSDFLSPDESLDNSLLGDDPLKYHNPFEEALASSDLEPRELQASAQDSPPPSSPQSSEEPNPARMAISSGLIPLFERVDELPPGDFNFLLTGDFAETGEPRVFRGIRDEAGGFVLENYPRYELSTGFIPFREGERVLTTDLNQDGAIDLVVVTEGSRSLVEVFEGKGGSLFQQWTSLSLTRNITGLSSFELSGDGQDDLVFIVEEVPHLLIYERAGSDFKYSRELVLPFAPGLLAEAQEDTGERRLYVFDSTLTEVVTLSPGDTDVFIFGLDSVLDRFNRVMVGGLSSSEFVVLDWGGKITLAQRFDDGLEFLGSFGVTYKTPLVIVGDYQGSGRRQHLFVP